MKLMTALFALVLSFGALASPVCDFPYDLSEDEGVVEIKRDAVDMNSRLNSLQKKQVVLTAMKLVEERPAGTLSVKEAIKALMDDSESGDVTYLVFSFKGVTYNMVEYYPGGNPYGLVFKGKEVVAARQDGDLVCENL